MSINRIMNQGKAALAANQIGLTTVSHNMSNVNTEGYSRQRVDFVTAPPANIGNVRVGGGVQIGGVTRAASEFTNRRIEEETTALGMLEGSTEVLSQLETVLHDDGEQGLSKAVSRFFNDIRTLSTQPESQPLRAAVRESANSITTRFQSAANGVEQVREDLDRRVSGAVLDINMLTKRIGDLNRRIMETEVQGNNANDERDSRDLALQQLSKIVNITVTPIENGGINVSSGKLGVLVNSVDATEFAVASGIGPDGLGSTRMHQVQYNGKLGKDVTDFVDSGSLGGYLKVRDTTIPGIQNKINSLAYGLSQNINAIHREAYGLGGEKGVDFFAPISNFNAAAQQLRVSDAVKEDAGNIAVGYKPGVSGDNRALLEMADLQDAKIFARGTATLVDHAAGIVGDLGVELKSLSDNHDTQRGLIEQLNTARERVSGVSLDEEAIHLMQFQKAFDASAKMIQVADNLMDTVLNLKRF